MFIAIVSRGLPSASDPYNGIFELDQGEALYEEGHKVAYFILDFRSIFKKRRFGIYKKNYNNKFPVVYISFPFGNIENRLCQFFEKCLVCIGAFYFKLILGKPDLIHSHFIQITNFAIVIKRIYKTPLVATEHSSSLNVDKIDHNLLRFGSSIYKKVDLLITVSSALQNRIKHNFCIDSYVVPNIVSLSHFNFNIRNISSLSENSFTFVSVGALTYNKGFDILLNAFHISNFPSNVFLNIIGQGELYNELNKKIFNYNLQNQVKLLGYKTRSEIYKLFSRSNAFVLASRGETFGVAYIEALLLGLPIIATECGGPLDIVMVENGLIVPIEDSEKLSRALILMYQKSNEYNSNLISETALKNYAPSVIAKKLTELYEYTINQL